MKILQPPGWPRPKGYANGVMAEGKSVFLGGMVGWDKTETIRSDDFVDQVRQALLNIVTVLAEAGAGPEHITRMIWYIKDRYEYLNSLKETGRVYREIIGSHYPAMTVVQVSDLIEDRAKLEIETTAVIPHVD
ncbi:MAG: RidA family protein [Gammaproteobacteria bacterium]